jgi:exopolyphosphatase/pppGpp-phosphohydrolase
MLTAEAVDDTVSVVREIQRKARSLGATSSIPLPEGPCLALDLGGGTLNIAWGTVAVGALPAEVKGFAALPLGARAMTRAFFRHDPPLAGEVEALCRRIMEVLTPHLPEVPRGVPAVGRPGRRVK